MAVKVSFCDLTHTGQVVSANTFPLGVAAVAAYAIQELGNKIDVEIFRYPDDYASWLKTNSPKIVCFSVFAWNMRLSHEFARLLKAVDPSVISVFGGVNIPNRPTEMREFLEKWPAIDFCIEGEGERAFVSLFDALEDVGFDANKLKLAHTQVVNTRYLIDGDCVSGKLMPRTADLSIFPSTFLNGLCDKFFDKHLIPMLETTRGCPYSCTFCHEGDKYFTKTHRFPRERVNAELDYIKSRVAVPDFIITDLNFGIFPDDIETAKTVAEIQDETGWPKFVTIATAKNNKERVLEISKILRGALPPGAAVQSTNIDVLETIKRKNLPIEAVREVARTAETDGAVSFSEVILCLPGDSKKSHFNSIMDVIGQGFTLIRTYQFLLLNGTEAANKLSREMHGLKTKFRVKPMNFGVYELRGEQFPVAEIEEIAVASNTMSYDDYLDCRDLSLTIETFNNNGIFYDLMQMLVSRGIERGDLIMAIYDNVKKDSGEISKLYQQFREEEKRNLWDSEEELAEYLKQPGIIDKYVLGEFGTNEIYKYRMLSTFYNIEEMHDIIYASALSLLQERGTLSEDLELYLEDLKRFSILRKRQLFDTDKAFTETFNFDFIALGNKNYAGDPLQYYRPDGIEIEIFHTEWQRDLISGYTNQFGTTIIGLGRILNRAHIAQMYRASKRVGTDVIVAPDLKRVSVDAL